MAGHLKRKTNGHLLRTSVGGHLVNGSLTQNILSPINYGRLVTGPQFEYELNKTTWISTYAAHLSSGQTTAYANLSANSIGGGATAPETCMMHIALGGNDSEPSYYTTCNFYGGATHYSVSDTLKANAVTAAIRYKPFLAQYYTLTSAAYAEIFTWPRHLSNHAIKLKFSESSTTFTTGSGLLGMSPDLTKNLSEMPSEIEAGGGSYPSRDGDNVLRDHSVYLYLTIPVETIKNMSGNDLYLWSCLTKSANWGVDSPWLFYNSAYAFQNCNVDLMPFKEVALMIGTAA